MSNQIKVENIYDLINNWKENCLLDNKGLIWTNERVWSDENMRSFREAFIDQPDTTGDSFYGKLEKQLAGESEGVYKYTIELLLLYYSVPVRTKYETKMNKLKEVSSWKNITLNESLSVFKVLDGGIASTGASYNTRIYHEISMLHSFAEKFKQESHNNQEKIIKDPKMLKRFVNKTRDVIGMKVQMQHVIQHLLLPDYFESIANWGHKHKIISVFSYLLDEKEVKSEDIDEQIYFIKQKLKDLYDDEKIDFYFTPHLRQQWYPDTSPSNYFRLTNASDSWSINHLEKGDKIDIKVKHQDGVMKKDISAFEKLKTGDLIILVDSKSSKELIGKARVEKGIHRNLNKEDIIEVSFEKSLNAESLKDSSFSDNENLAILYEITKEEFESIVNWNDEYVKELTPPIETGNSIDKVPFDIDLDPELLDLVFENEDILLNQIITALKNGNHIILTGPPGTGKSKLAKQICKLYDVNAQMVTASSNWSTYDTIGGYRPDINGQLYFSPGIFLQSFKDSKTNKQKNDWLIIDEINRADIDKAFGSLFSVLTGDDVTLPFEASNRKQISLEMQKNRDVLNSEENTYMIPEDWRIIATMNTVDKAALFEMSYAFMRRFAFIPVGIPRNINKTLINQYLNMWDINEYPYVKELTDLWKLINKYRKIGPAIILDIVKYTMKDDDFTSAIILYVLPQFEGLAPHKLKDFISDLIENQELIPGRTLIEDFVEDFFYLGDV